MKPFVKAIFIVDYFSLQLEQATTYFLDTGSKLSCLTSSGLVKSNW